MNFQGEASEEYECVGVEKFSWDMEFSVQDSKEAWDGERFGGHACFLGVKDMAQ